MKTFLQMVAKDLYEKVGADLSKTAVVFPNKRAALFFNEELAFVVGKPLWLPAYLSISDLFATMTPLDNGDSIRLVCELYKIFRSVTGSEETLDDFYFWGEMLISDFDDIDKNLADATKLFLNLQELKDMEDYSFLSENQKESLKKFFTNFSIEKSTELKKRFLSVWDKLGDIYEKFKKRLTDIGIAYEGMVYRDAIENIGSMTSEYNRFVFVGFNVLNKVEQKLFYELQKKGTAMFYWDYDTYYVNNLLTSGTSLKHEAGMFINENMKSFPNQLGKECFDVMRQGKTVRYIASPTENAQTRYFDKWHASLEKGREKENAVVLCNEDLLQAVLHSLPETVSDVNITMGFPLSQTPVYSLVNEIADLCVSGYNEKTERYRYEYVSTVLKHPYVVQMSENARQLWTDLTKKNRFFPSLTELSKDDVLKTIFKPVSDNKSLCQKLLSLLTEASVIFRDKDMEHDIFSQLYRESLFKTYTIVNRLMTLVDDEDLKVGVQTFRKLLNRLLHSTSIPFHGEPAVGIQIMGVLETRNLDFKNLLMLSVNEGKLPKGEKDLSFIPYNLRKAFGLTTVEHKNSVYAYYFYRLLQRAENITLMYNISTDGLNRGEMSRFMLQYMVEGGQNIIKERLEAGQAPDKPRIICINKTPEVLERLINRYDTRRNDNKYLSPTALNTYISCTLKFYYHYVAGISKQDEVSTDIDSAMFGTIFHRAAELMYEDLTTHGNVVDKESLEKLKKEHYRIENYVDCSFKENFFLIKNSEKAEYDGNQQINRRVIIRYLELLIDFDSRYAPFTIEGLEQEVTEDITVETPDGLLPVRIGGKIDRLDLKDGILRVIDYKTGGGEVKSANIENLFNEGKGRDYRIFQAFLYASILCKKRKEMIAPALLLIHHAADEKSSCLIKTDKNEITDFSVIEKDFTDSLNLLLSEIFNPDIPFSQCEDKDTCSKCDFKALCKVRNR